MRIFTIDREKCTECMDCMMHCPANAIALSKDGMELDPQPRRANKLSYDDHIHHRIDRLKHIRRQKRHGKCQQPPWHAAVQKVLIL